MPIEVTENECRDAISEMLDSMEDYSKDVAVENFRGGNVLLVVEYMGRTIFKSILLSKLNGNPFLSKDHLTRIKNSVYFNNAEEYMSAAKSSTTCLLGLGSDCRVLFLQSPNLNVPSTLHVV